MNAKRFNRYATGIISQYLNQLFYNLEKLKKKNHITALHDIRVASRRLRTALWIFKQLYPQTRYQHWKDSVKNFSKSLGETRDLDVHIAFLKKLLSQQDPADSSHKPLAIYLETLRRQRMGLVKKIFIARDAFLKKSSLEDLSVFLLDSKTVEKDLPSLGKLMDKKIGSRLATFLSFEEYVYTPSMKKELHALRIAAKHLRYTLEIFSVEEKDLNRFAAYARAVQRILGKLHDFDVWQEVIPDRSHALGRYLEAHYTALRHESYLRFVKIWERQRKKRIWQELEKRIHSF